MTKKNKLELLDFNIKCFLITEINLKDDLEKLIEIRELSRKINSGTQIYLNNKNERIHFTDFKPNSFPIKLILIPYSDDIENIIVNGLFFDGSTF